MITIGIISEYNPFHNGHLYQIETARKIFGENCAVVAVMSGNFVQRGEMAILDKWSRARAALLSGVNLVIELPVSYATGSAERFADGGIAIAAATGICDFVVFGSECGDLEKLEKIAEILAFEPASYKEYLKTYLDQGFSFPVSRTKALNAYDQSLESDKILSTSNNILAIEYIKAIKRRDIKSMKPFTIKREGQSYNDTKPVGLSSDPVNDTLFYDRDFSVTDSDFSVTDRDFSDSNIKIPVPYADTSFSKDNFAVQSNSVINRINSDIPNKDTSKFISDINKIEKDNALEFSFEKQNLESFWSASAIRMFVRNLSKIENFADTNNQELKSKQNESRLINSNLTDVSYKDLFEGLGNAMPKNSLAILIHNIIKNNYIESYNAFGKTIYACLRVLSLEYLNTIPGMSEGISNRLKEYTKASVSPNCFMDNIVTYTASKRHPKSRIQRAITHMLLGIKEEDFASFDINNGPLYLRILGFDKKGQYLLKKMKRQAKLPIMMKGSDFLEYAKNKENLALRRMAELDCIATDLWMNQIGKESGLDFTTPPVAFPGAPKR